ncbi:MAG: GID complex subunit containing RING finger motif [Vezdaea aestivalis]|nr:MAG: GID complex subunit containing RING finger motif [Vezdaea aestivalis]
MAELKEMKLNPESQLYLDQPLLRLPYELIRRNFQNSRVLATRESTAVLTGLQGLQGNPSPENAVDSIDSMIVRMQGLKRKLEAINSEDKVLHDQSKKRLQHLQELYEIPSLVDVRFERWSRSRLDRLLVDYMLRTGYIKSASSLARERNISDLVDIKPFVQYIKIRESLKRHSTQECLTWCLENKHTLRKISEFIEFEIRLQQYIELVRTREPSKLLEAIIFGRKHFAFYKDSQAEKIKGAAALLAYEEDASDEPYMTLYSPGRWDTLVDLFTAAHNGILSLPDRPLLHIALSAGLSALKTPSCHPSVASSSSSTSYLVTRVCPICSTELNELARRVPYAHQTKSHVDNDPVVLPNGRIYGRERLMMLNEKLGLPENRMKDPATGSEFDASEIRKVYIT